MLGAVQVRTLARGAEGRSFMQYTSQDGTDGGS